MLGFFSHAKFLPKFYFPFKSRYSYIDQCLSAAFTLQVDTQLPTLKQAGFKQADLEQQKSSEDIPKAVPTVRKTDLMQVKGEMEILVSLTTVVENSSFSTEHLGLFSHQIRVKKVTPTV